jgi:RNA polymerase sigma factor (sigma-70 family)
MSLLAEEQRPEDKSGGLFLTTHWSVVLLAGGESSPQATEALEQLCRSYWYPLYVYVRRRGYSAEDAQDLTQQFFAHFLKKGYFRLADPARGRFRTFLLHALGHFLTNEWKQAHRFKRGNGVRCFSLEADETERRFSQEPAGPITPERAYEKRWALTLLQEVLNLVRQEYARMGKSSLFDELGQFLWGKEASVSYAQIGERLGMSETATRTAMHRLRGDYRERLRAEVAKTVASPADVDDELRYLISVVGEKE